MTKKKTNFLANWQENWAGLVVGAIVVVIIALLVVNFINRGKEEQIDNGASTDITTSQEEKSNQYKIVAGDSLSKIAQNYYQDESYWIVLARANNILNPNVIYVDTNLQIPSKEDAGKMRDEMTQTTYKVAQGDTLFTIAEKMYGDGSRWAIISKANNLGRLPNGNPLVFADSTIRIPR
ncbi:hypothetical protein A3A60_02420 [Candidatus Curtissbacteria bacterium RIFCSPLOWO2_01_FULL_42_26]|uniref:LysM domain-containing protein n=1 Tax=Candidatus Curtissbacteria bacterium RIFCSPLOWO2_01_FULL_42_26 TaxID=1797729 RepID=A0A1F5I318_9BACT|nr:MAG: hypothetical protein A3A60_02420 [Candidatus Curtissbacteria bacterium RIFCSPLOWO2_01_FULL_42_26]